MLLTRPISSTLKDQTLYPAKPINITKCQSKSINLDLRGISTFLFTIFCEEVPTEVLPSIFQGKGCETLYVRFFRSPDIHKPTQLWGELVQKPSNATWGFPLMVRCTISCSIEDVTLAAFISVSQYYSLNGTRPLHKLVWICRIALKIQGWSREAVKSPLLNPNNLSKANNRFLQTHSAKIHEMYYQ